MCARALPLAITRWQTTIMKHIVIFFGALLVAVALHAQTLSDALNTNLTWTTGGDVGAVDPSWLPEANVAVDGLGAQSAGPLTASGQNSWVETTVSGSGFLFFSWKANLQGYIDYGAVGYPHRGGRFDLYLNGNINRTSYGNDWSAQYIYCDAPTNTIRWMVSDENGYSSGQDTAWLDNVTFFPDPSVPQFWSQPAPQIQKVAEGGTINFSAEALGTAPLFYQWQKDGANLSAATSSVLTLTNVTLDQTGTYTLIVSNASGSVTSSNATLTVVHSVALNKIGEWPGYERSATESVAVDGNRAYIGNVDWDTYGVFLVLDVSDPNNPTLLGKLTGTHENFNHLRVVDGYVYAGFGSGGLDVIDVSNPAQPQIVKNLSLGNISDLQIAGNYAYAVSYNSGLVVLDISQPAQPVIVTNIAPVCFAQGVSVVGNYAYVVGRCGGTMAVLDISNPASPVVVSTLGLGQPADRIVVTNNTAFIGGWFSMEIVNVSDPVNPVVITNMPGYAVAISGTDAFVGNGTNLLVLDVSVPTNVVQVGSCYLSDYVENLQIAGNFAYIANWKNGLTIVDLSTPLQPQIRGNFPSGGEGLGIEVVGDTAFLCDGKGGLQILDVSDPAQPVALSRYFAPSDYGPDQVKIAGNLAYVPYYSAGLHILDVSDPSHPILKGICPTVYARKVDVSGNYAYLGSSSSPLQIVDVSDPTHPVQIPQTNITAGVDFIKFSGHYAYIKPSYSDHLLVLDISDPTQPVQVSDTPFASQPWNFFIQDNNLFADGQIADISNPTAPAVVGQCGGRGYVECVSNIAFIADGYGLSAFDFGAPPTVELGHTDLTGWSQAVKIVGQHAFVADSDWGLQVFQLPAGVSSAPPIVAPAIGSDGTGGFGLNGLGQFHFAFTNQRGVRYIVEYVNSLGDPNWITLTNIQALNVPVQVIDPSPHSAARFYRIRTQR